MVGSGQGTGDRSLMSFGPPAWLSGYRRPWLTRDAVAGLTLWALVVPEAMAYASIAGVPPQFGLYAVPLAVLAYAWLGSSTRLFVGPSSTVCALTATVVAPLAAAGGDDYVLMTAVLSLIVGVVFIALGLLRMGFLSRLFAEPVLDGFIVGLGLYIAVGQVPKLAGLEKPEGNSVQQVGRLLSEIGSWNLASVALGAAALAALFLLHRLAPKVPAALVVVVVSLALVPLLSLEDRGVAVVGEIPAGFAFVSWSGLTLDHVIALVPGALTVVIVGFAESLAVVKAYAAKDGTQVDANRELLAYGAASIGSGVLQGFPPAGSLSKSAAAETSGAKSPLAFVTAGALVVLTILLLTGVFATLPEPVLGAIVIHAVAGMIQPRSIWRLRQIRVPDFWLALSAFLGVVLIDVTAGIVIGLVLSLVLLLQRLGQPHVALLGQHPERGFVDTDVYPDAVPLVGTLVMRIDGPLVFANVDPVLDELRRAIREADPRPDLVILDFEATYEIDVTAATALARNLQDLAASGVEVRFAAVHASVREYAGRLSLDPLAGLDDPYPSVADALADRARP
jgi:sulfate permease, SulP family